jgi:hypothetical protein
VYFTSNERSLGVKNGSLGTIEKIEHGVLQVRMDGEANRRVAVDSRYYAHLEHGYATTAHKTQAATVDRAFVLATPHFDRHATYVALSRHREGATMFYATEDFAGKWEPSRASYDEIHEVFTSVLSRARPKDLAHDYFDRAPEANPGTERRVSAELTEESFADGPELTKPKDYAPPISMDMIDAMQQRAAERWLEKQRARELGLSTLDQGHSADLRQEAESLENSPLAQKDIDTHDLSRGGLEDELDL